MRFILSARYKLKVRVLPCKNFKISLWQSYEVVQVITPNLSFGNVNYIPTYSLKATGVVIVQMPILNIKVRSCQLLSSSFFTN